MIRALFRDSVIYAVPALLSRGLALLLIPLYTRVLNPADYGSLDLLLLFSHIVKLTIALEVSQGVARFYSAEPDPSRRVTYSSSAFWFTLSVYTIFAFLMWINTKSLASFLMGQTGLEAAFRLGILYIWLQGLFYLAQNQFRFELRPKNYAIVSVLMSFATGGFAVWFTVGLNMGLEGLLLGMIVGTAAGTGLGLWWLRTSFRFRFKGSFLREMLVFSAPLVLSSVAVWATLYIDRIMINYFLTVSDVGLYGLGYRVASIAGLVMVGFQGALTPLIYSNYKKTETPEQLAKIFRIFVALSLSIFLFLSLFSETLINVIAPDEYISASSVVVFLVPAVLLANMYIFAPGAAIAKKTSIFAKINLLGACLNVLLNYLLIPEFGIDGASLATLSSYIFIFYFHMFTSQKLYPVPHQWSILFIGVVFATISVVISLNLNFEGISEFYVKMICILVFGVLSIFVGLLKLKEIKFAFSWLLKR